MESVYQFFIETIPGYPEDEAATYERLIYRQREAGDLFLGYFEGTKLIGVSTIKWRKAANFNIVDRVAIVQLKNRGAVLKHCNKKVKEKFLKFLRCELLFFESLCSIFFSTFVQHAILGIGCKKNQ